MRGKFWAGLILFAAAFVGAQNSFAILKFQATFTGVQGDVKVSTAPKAAWLSAEKGLRCGAGATVKTGPSGFAELVFDDASALRIEKNTELTLREVQQEKKIRNVFVEMFKGRLLSNIPKTNKYGTAKFRVKTPQCSAAVRGTQFVTESSSSGASVAVYEGSVAAENPSVGGEVEVAANQQTIIAGNAPPAAPHPLSAEMESYRKNIADLFAARINELREDMEAVRMMNQEYMDRHREKMQEEMDDYNGSVQDLMEEYRKQLGQ